MQGLRLREGRGHPAVPGRPPLRGLEGVVVEGGRVERGVGLGLAGVWGLVGGWGLVGWLGGWEGWGG